MADAVVAGGGPAGSAAALALAAMAAVSFLVLRWQSGEDTLPPPSIAPQAGSAE